LVFAGYQKQGKDQIIDRDLGFFYQSADHGGFSVAAGTDLHAGDFLDGQILDAGYWRPPPLGLCSSKILRKQLLPLSCEYVGNLIRLSIYSQLNHQPRCTRAAARRKTYAAIQT
jgi:hypothetical protein